MTAPTTLKPGKRVVFLTASKGKPAEHTAMLKSIDGQPLAKPIEIANAGPLSHLVPLVDTLDKRRKRRAKEQPPKVKCVKVSHA